MNGNNCGDTSNGGNHQIDWRLPNIRELLSLVNYAFFGPVLSNAAGTGHATTSDPFSNWPVSTPTRYWSSTTDSLSGGAWFIYFDIGFVHSGSKDIFGNECCFVLPVRGGS
jgi:hypothetical protein